MPRKIIELTLQLEVQKVSCPGVWLCQDGRVSLTVFALDTSYQTCLLPPMFPLMFHDVFYFRKRFQETCAVNNICCLLKNETIYCELVQWCDNCSAGECTILAQYLGALNDVLFPSNMCSSEGVDLLMRRTKEFPGILAPKIEVSTKVRLDEIFGQSYDLTTKSVKIKACSCKRPEGEPMRQKQVCHSPLYHRFAHAHGIKCNTRPRSRSRSRSRNCLSASSCCSLKDPDVSCSCPKSSMDYQDEGTSDKVHHKLVLRSNFIDRADCNDPPAKTPHHHRSKLKTFEPCICEICKRYHEMFKNTSSKSVNTCD